MSVIQRAELLLQAKNYSGSGDWLDESGNGHNAQLGSTSGADTNDPLFKPYDGTQYLYLPGTSGNYVSSADVNLLDADTAHLHQSKGFSNAWYQVDNDNPAQSDDLTPIIGDYHGIANPSGAVSGAYIIVSGYAHTTGIPVTEAEEYTLSAVVSSDQADMDAQMRIVWFTAAGATISESVGSFVSLPQNALSTRISVTATAPATAAFASAVIGWQADSGNLAATDKLYWDAVCFCTGSSSSFVPSLRIVGDLDMRAKAAATDWTAAANQTLIHKAASNNGYSLQITTGGELLGWHGDGTDYNPGTSSGAALSDGTSAELRATLDISAGTWTYYKDGTSFDTDSVGAVTPVADTTTAGLVGAATSSTLLFAGDLEWAEVRDGIDGPVVARYDSTDAAEPFATQTGSTDGRTWTYNRSASGLVSTVVDRDMFLLTTDDYLEIADDAALDFAAADPLTIMAVVRTNTIAAGSDVVVAKKDDLTTAAGYALTRSTATGQIIIADGTADDDDTVTGLAIHTLSTVAGRRSITADNITAFLNGVASGSATTDSTTATLANALPLRIGATSGTAGSFWEGNIIAVALWREALTDADIATATNELAGIFASASTGRLLVLGLL